MLKKKSQMIHIQPVVFPEKEYKEKMINEIIWKTFPELIRDTSFQTEEKKKCTKYKDKNGKNIHC